MSHKKSSAKSEESAAAPTSIPAVRSEFPQSLDYKDLGRKEAPPPVPKALPGKETPAPQQAAPAQRPAQSQPPEIADLAAGAAEKGESSGASQARAGRGALPAAPRAAAPGSVDRLLMAPAPSPQVVEVKSEDVGLFERRVRDFIASLTGRIVNRQASEEGLSLAVELPQSREEEFRATLRKESGADFPQDYAPKEQPPAVAVGAAQRSSTEKRKSAPEKDEPTVRIELRIWAKK